MSKYKIGDVSDEDIESIELAVGMGSSAWGFVAPKEIIAAAWNRLVPDTGAERALRLLRRLNDALDDNVVFLSPNRIRNRPVWDVLGLDGVAKYEPIATGNTPLAAVEAAAKSLGVELGEGE